MAEEPAAPVFISRLEQGTSNPEPRKSVFSPRAARVTAGPLRHRLF